MSGISTTDPFERFAADPTFRSLAAAAADTLDSFGDGAAAVALADWLQKQRVGIGDVLMLYAGESPNYDDMLPGKALVAWLWATTPEIKFEGMERWRHVRGLTGDAAINNRYARMLPDELKNRNDWDRNRLRAKRAVLKLFPEVQFSVRAVVSCEDWESAKAGKFPISDLLAKRGFRPNGPQGGYFCTPLVRTPDGKTVTLTAAGQSAPYIVYEVDGYGVTLRQKFTTEHLVPLNLERSATSELTTAHVCNIPLPHRDMNFRLAFEKMMASFPSPSSADAPPPPPDEPDQPHIVNAPPG